MPMLVYTDVWIMCGLLVLTQRALLRVVHGKQQGQRRANRLLSTAARTAVLHFTAKQPANHRLPRGTQRTAMDTKHKLFITQFLCNLLHWIDWACVSWMMQVHCGVHTCCWLLCMLEVLPAPAFPDAAVREWNGSSSGWDAPDGLSLSVHQSQPGSNPTQRPLGLSGKPGENYWPVKETNKSSVQVHMLCMTDSSDGKDLQLQLVITVIGWKALVYLAGVSSAQV